MIDDKISSTDLDVLIGNHKDNFNSPFITNSVVIELSHLEEFINKARIAHGAAFDAIKFHFIRYELTQDNQEYIKKIPNKDLTQVSLALVPAKITDPAEWIVDDLKKNNKKITLLVCKPATAWDKDDKTGVCPPKCGGT